MSRYSAVSSQTLQTLFIIHKCCQFSKKWHLKGILLLNSVLILVYKLNTLMLQSDSFPILFGKWGGEPAFWMTITEIYCKNLIEWSKWNHLSGPLSFRLVVFNSVMNQGCSLGTFPFLFFPWGASCRVAFLHFHVRLLQLYKLMCFTGKALPLNVCVPRPTNQTYSNQWLQLFVILAICLIVELPQSRSIVRTQVWWTETAGARLYCRHMYLRCETFFIQCLIVI